MYEYSLESNYQSGVEKKKNDISRASLSQDRYLHHLLVSSFVVSSGSPKMTTEEGRRLTGGYYLKFP
jgi:hypothetical protein